MPTILGITNNSINAEDSLQKKGKHWVYTKRHRLTYSVLSDNINQNEYDILATVGLPPLFFVSKGAMCKTRRATEVTRIARHPSTGVVCSLWDVEYEFDSEVNEEDNQSDPTQKPPMVRWYGETEEEVMEKDIDGNPIETDAKEPIFITRPIVIPVLEVTRYEAYPFDPDTILDYANHTNKEKFYNAPKRTALMLPMEVEEEIIENVKYCKVTYRVKFKIRKEGNTMQEDTWKAKVLHHGFKYRPAAGQAPIIYQDKNGNPATVNLVNGTGVKKGDGDPPDYKEFSRFPEVDFNNLELGPF